MQDSDQISRFVEQLRVMADPIRLRIIRLLDSKELSVGSIIDVLELPQPTVSRKLGELRRAGILTNRKHAKNIYYSWSKEFAQSQLKVAVMTTQTPEFLRDLTAIERLKAKHKGGSRFILK